MQSARWATRTTNAEAQRQERRMDAPAGRSVARAETTDSLRESSMDSPRCAHLRHRCVHRGLDLRLAASPRLSGDDSPRRTLLQLPVALAGAAGREQGLAEARRRANLADLLWLHGSVRAVVSRRPSFAR